MRRRVRRDGVVPDDDAPRGVTLRQTRVQPRHLHLLPRRPAPSRVTQHRLHVRVPRYFVAVSDDPRRGVDETDADDAGVPRLLAAELAVSTSHRVPSRFAGARVRRRASRDLRGDVSAVVVVSQDGVPRERREIRTRAVHVGERARERRIIDGGETILVEVVAGADDAEIRTRRGVGDGGAEGRGDGGHRVGARVLGDASLAAPVADDEKRHLRDARGPRRDW